MNSQLIVCLLVLAAACGSSQVEARPKRSVIYAAAPTYVATAPVVAAAPAVVHSHVVHNNPTSVVKTEQVRSGDHASYSYSSEVKNEPVVHTHTHTHTAAVAAAPVATAHAVATYPAATYHYAHYPAATYSHYSTYPFYSPYSYVIGK